MSDFNRLLYNQVPKPSTAQRPQGAVQGVIRSVEDTTATVIIADFSANHFFGPIPFTRTDNPPQVGDQCLVVFTNSPDDRGWVVAWQVIS